MKKGILIHGLPTDSFYKELNKKENFFVTESRPDLTGSRIVVKKLAQQRIKPTLICDNMAAFCMQQNKISKVYIFYQSIKDKKLLCKVGSLGLAILAKRHKLNAYAFPGKKLRKRATKKEMIYLKGKLIAPRNVSVYRELIDEVPVRFIKKVITK
ncbi:hypothetical protein ACFL38_01035 [Candidatus Omnitrophota bacterium]